MIAVFRYQTDTSEPIGQIYPYVGGWQAFFERFSLEYMTRGRITGLHVISTLNYIRYCQIPFYEVILICIDIMYESY